MPTSIADRERRARLVFLRDLARIGVLREVRDDTDWSNRRAARYALQPYLPTDGDPLRDFQDLRYALTASGVRNTDVLTAAGGRRPWNIGDKASRGRWRRKDGADGGGGGVARPWSNHPNTGESSAQGTFTIPSRRPASLNSDSLLQRDTVHCVPSNLEP